ncbi:MAG: Helix-turn-helix domain [Actinomycetota bacterium]|nr:Helix-turn-helix domain [Actinomycetota bacterium]
MRWVLGLRLREAGHRLAGTSDPIGVIAADGGFSHPQHLSTAFRRARGISPSQYRATLWSDVDGGQPIVGMKAGARRAGAAFSNAAASARIRASAQRPAKNETPIGSGPANPAGTDTLG